MAGTNRNSHTKIDEICVCVLGNARVGKSSIIQRLANLSFSGEYVPTIGVDFESTHMDLDTGPVRVNIYDISGESRFLSTAKDQIAQADAFVYVYDITSRESFKAAKRWQEIINPNAKATRLPRLLLGNMLDLRHKQAVTSIEAKEYAIPEGMKHVECSALSGKNVNAAFFILANDVISYRRLGNFGHVGSIQNDSRFSLIQTHDTPEVRPTPDTSDYTHVFRILLMGMPRVGKSAIRLQYCRNHFSKDYYASVGLEYSTRSLIMDGEKVKIQLWDVSGDPLYDETRRNYYRGANAYIIVYDITNRKTFEYAERMVKELDMYEQSDCPKIIVGNKSDRSMKRDVCLGHATDWANGWRIPLLEISAKNDVNINEAVLKLATALKDKCVPWKKVYNF